METDTRQCRRVCEAGERASAPECTVTPSLRSSGWGLAEMKTYRSPASPLLQADSCGTQKDVPALWASPPVVHPDERRGGQAQRHPKQHSAAWRGPVLTAAPHRPRPARAACCLRPRRAARAARSACCPCSGVATSMGWGEGQRGSQPHKPQARRCVHAANAGWSRARHCTGPHQPPSTHRSTHPHA